MVCNFVVVIKYWCQIIILLIRWVFRNAKKGQSNNLSCLVGKTAIVTGGNGGIGFMVSALLASRGCRVLIACRSDAKETKNRLIELTNNRNIEIRKLDLSSLQSVREFAKNIRNTEEKIDILVNNAGVVASDKSITDDGLNTVTATNYFGAFLLTHLLVDSLRASEEGRIVFVTSGLAHFQMLTVENLNIRDGTKDALRGFLTYANSKFCNEIAGQEFAKRLGKYNITVTTADTGVSKTTIADDAINKLQGYFMCKIFSLIFFIFSRDTLGAAQTTFHLAATEDSRPINGAKYFRCELFPKVPRVNDQPFCDQIWQKTEELVQLRPEERI